MANYFPLIVETGASNALAQLPAGDFLDLSESGISNSGNITLNGVLSANGTIYSGNILPLANGTYNLGSNSAAWSSLHVAGNTIYLGTLQLKDIGSNTFAVYTSDGTTQANLDVGSIDVSAITQGTSSIGLAGVNGNAYITVNGTSNVLVVSTTGVNVTGILSATGNVAGNYVLGNGALLTGLGTVSSNAAIYLKDSANAAAYVYVDSANSAVVLPGNGGFLYSGDNTPNTFGSIDVIPPNDHPDVGYVALTFLNSGCIIANPLNSVKVANAGITFSYDYDNQFSGTQTATFNELGLSTAGNITGGNINTNNIVSTGNLNLTPTGNIVVNSTYIGGVSDPVQNQDVATKNYVDIKISSGISYHQSVAVATTTTLATTTGGSITYTQPNGAGNGVGALLTTTGTFNLIDTANVQTVGTRILVKDQANAVQNGVYAWANATNIVRATDADEYGADSATQLSVNDYFFVTGGNVNAGAAFVVNTPTSTITFGTSNITFATFSTSQVYSANTLAGISLAGTVINAKVDGITTAFDGSGNISVKASANLTTPNIGAATGTSLSVTGNITGGNLLAGSGRISTGGNITGGNLNAAGLSLSGNVVSNLVVTGNVDSANLVTLGTVFTGAMSATGNVIIDGDLEVNGNLTYLNIDSLNIEDPIIALGRGANNQPLVTDDLKDRGTDLWYYEGSEKQAFFGYKNSTGKMFAATDVSITNEVVTVNDYGTFVVGNLEGATVSTTGNITGGNVNAGSGVITTSGNITGGNLNAAGLSLSSNVVSALNVTANISGGNITTPGLISVNGNITGGNIITSAAVSAGSVSSSGNVTGGNVLAGTGIISTSGNITGGNVNAGGLSLSGNVLSEINTTSNVTTTANIAASYYSGNGYFLTGIITSVANINNGNSNVSIDTPNANITVAVTGTSNVVVWAPTGEYVTGLISATGNITGANINGNGSGLSSITGANVSGDVSGANHANVADSANSVAGGNVSGQVGNALVAGTVYTAAQPNITSVGILTSLSSSGNITGGNLLTSGNVSTENIVNPTANTSIGMGNGSGIVAIYSAGNATQFAPNGQITLGGASKIVGGTFGGSGVTLGGSQTDIFQNRGGNVTVQVGTGGTIANTWTFAQDGSFSSPGAISAVGNVTGGNLNAAGLSLSSNVVSNLNVTANITGGNIVTPNTVYSNTAQFTTAAYANAVVTERNQLATKFYVDNQVAAGINIHEPVVSATTGNLTATYTPGGTTPTWTDIVNGTTLVTGSAHGLTVNDQITFYVTTNGIVANLAYFVYDTPNATSITLSDIWVGTQITTLTNGTGLSITSRATPGVGATLTNAGTQAALASDGVTLNVSDRLLVRNQTNAAQNGIYVVSDTGSVSTDWILTRSSDTNQFAPQSPTGLSAGDYVYVTDGLTEAGTSYVETTNAYIIIGTTNLVYTQFSGAVTYTGNSPVTVTGQTIGLAAVTGIGNTVVLQNSPSLTSPNIGAAVGTSVSTSGNVTGGNIITSAAVSAGSVSASGNIIGGNLNAAGLSLSSNVLSVINSVSAITTTANVTGGNVITGGAVSAASISASGNITGGNILGGANVNATLFTGTTVSVSGNVTGGNVNVTTAVVAPTVRNTGALTVSTSSGNLNLEPTGNIVVNSKYINGVLDPVQDQDVATKAYVDNFATTGISYHQPVVVATTTTLATTTGGTITYSQPNGAGNGVGALLTTTGTFNLIDTANVQTVGTRILVKNEANAVLNGVYTWANATNIVRSTDTDEYGPDSVEQLSINDYFFVTGGNVNAGAAFIVSAPAGTITFGTSNITFSTFSTSQVYSANTAAGISLDGTIINAKVDGVTTSFDGFGNISVKASANLTTPNIGAATGTSVSVTGNITGGNLNAAGLSLSSNVVSALNVTANVTSGNVNTPGLISAAGTITGGNILTVGLISATGNLTSGNSRVFGDSATGANSALFGPNGHTALPNTVVQLTGNSTVYVQVNAQNLSGAGSADFVVTANNGTDTTYYIDMGMNGNTFSDPNYTILGANDGYLYTVGSSATAPGTAGNLVLGSTSGVVKVFVGNTITANLITTTSTTGFSVAGIVSATGNVTGGNLITAGAFSAASVSTTGNITGGNLNAAGLSLSSNVVSALNSVSAITTTANITGGNLNAAGLSLSSNVVSALNVTSNITGGNILTPGLISAAGDITGANITTSGANATIGSSTGAATYNVGTGATTTGVTKAINIGTGGTAGSTTTIAIGPVTATTAAATATFNTATTVSIANTGGTALSVAGNITGGNIAATTHTGTTVSVTGTITGASVVGGVMTGTSVSVTGNITGGNILTGGQLISTQTGVTTTGGGQIYLNGATLNRIDYNANGVNPPTFTTRSAGTKIVLYPGIAAAAADYALGIESSTLWFGLPSTAEQFKWYGGTTQVGSLSGGGAFSVTGNVTGAGHVGTIYTNSIINTGANLTGNIGSSTLYFNTVFAKATSAQYADLAERYVADANYPPGTVLIFGGEQEVTANIVSHSTAIAGVVSENPSYLMNAGLQGEHVVSVALLGRVPCQVQGAIRKGDLLVASDVAGVAQRLDMSKYLPGCVIGKALADYDSDTVGVIEIAVGVK